MILRPFQHLRDILRPSAGAGGRELALGAYGKLHLYKDYINLACTDGDGAEYKRWLDQAFGATYETLGGRSVEPGGPRRILWPIDGNHSWAVAMLWPSADAGGLRKFPFSFFTTIPRRAIGS